MRKWLAALFCCLMMASAALAEETSADHIAASVPAEVLEHLAAFHPDYQLEGYAELMDSPMGQVRFSLIRCEHGRMLHGFRQEDNKWVNWLDNAKGIPQAEELNVSLYIQQENTGYSQLWYSEDVHPFTTPGGPVVCIRTDNGETIEERVTYLIREEGLFLFSYGDHPNCQIDVVEDELVFYNISYGYDGKVRFSFPTDILAVDFYALPRNVQDVRITGTGEPNLPAPDTYNPLEEWDNFLEKQDVKLRSGKYPVYMGPGKEFGRAANGKASVSTNGWVQVFGEYDGWLLIQYAISEEQYRFGWITDDALAKGQKVNALPLTFGDWVNTEEPIDLMDDPLNSRTSLLHLPRWTQMEQLAQLGDGYSLIRVTVDGKTHWGFVYSWPLGHG